MNVVAAFLRRDFRIDTSYRASFALRSFSILFFLALYFYLSRIVDESELATREHLSGGYFGYAAVGLALLSVLQVGLASFSRKLREEQTTGTFEALMAAPASPSLIVLSSALYDLIRALFFALVMIGAAVALFGLKLELQPASLGVATVTLVGALALFAAVGVAVAAFTVIFKQTAALLGMVVSVLALLGGVYFPISLLPGPIEQVATILPFTWALDVLRASLLGGDIRGLQVAGLFVSAMLLLPAALVGFRLAVRRAQRTGTLAQY